MANQVAYGFMNLTDLFNQRVTQVGAEVVTAAIEASLAEHTRQMDALLRLFVKRTTGFKMRYRTATAARLQPMDNSGRARPIRPGGKYDVAFPLQGGAAAWGHDYVTGIKMTVEEANSNTAALLSADFRWIRDHILSALFAVANWTFNDEDDNVGALTIKPLANGDTDKYMVLAGADDVGVDTHQLAQAAAILDASNPFPTIHSELVEHPENGGDVISLIPTNQRSAVEALGTFRPISDPNITPDLNTAVLTGKLGVVVPGEVIGYVEKVWIAEWRALPDNYIVSVTSDGEPPLGMREDPEVELQGFKQVATRDDHPWYERQYLRRAGFGAWNRAGAVVTRIGNGSYAVPTGYTPPMG